MSLETALESNTKAILELIGWLQLSAANKPTDTGTVTASPEAKPAQAAVAENTASLTPAAPAQKMMAEEVVLEPAAEEVEPSDAAENVTPPTYEECGAALTALAKAKGREAAVAVLAKFGVGKLPEADPKDFSAIMAACEKELV